MKFENTREWLARKLAHADDTDVAAGGTDFEKLRRDAEARTVTPSVFADVPGQIGRVVRYIREQRGWSQREMADLAAIDEGDVVKIETLAGYQLAPRTLMNLADICGFSRRRFQLLANHIVPNENHTTNIDLLRFAARSKNIGSISVEELEAVRVLVEVLSGKRDDQA